MGENCGIGVAAIINTQAFNISAILSGVSSGIASVVAPDVFMGVAFGNGPCCCFGVDSGIDFCSGIGSGFGSSGGIDSGIYFCSGIESGLGFGSGVGFGSGFGSGFGFGPGAAAPATPAYTRRGRFFRPANSQMHRMRHIEDVVALTPLCLKKTVPGAHTREHSLTQKGSKEKVGLKKKY